ncbi:MAG: hypothetical protein Kow00107_02620 [Planctomycetota bacterium]
MKHAGIDEAGYGAVIGPLAHACAVSDAHGWRDEFRSAGLAIGDSKRFFAKGGAGALERVVLSAARSSGWRGTDLASLLKHLECPADMGHESFEALDTSLPHFTTESIRDDLPNVKIRCRLTFPHEYNKLLATLNNKSTLAMSRVAQLLNAAVRECNGPMEIVIDKQGGRNRYTEFLFGCFPGSLVQTLAEGPEVSEYRAGGYTIRFLVRSEENCPETALASMAAKYLRELFMDRFRTYWLRRAPGVHPTAGYPVDGARFIRELFAARPDVEDSLDLMFRAK